MEILLLIYLVGVFAYGFYAHRMSIIEGAVPDDGHWFAIIVMALTWPIMVLLTFCGPRR